MHDGDDGRSGDSGKGSMRRTLLDNAKVTYVMIIVMASN